MMQMSFERNYIYVDTIIVTNKRVLLAQDHLGRNTTHPLLCIRYIVLVKQTAFDMGLKLLI